MKTIPVSVYRTLRLGDCSNGAPSSRADTMYLACEDGWFNRPEDDTCTLRLVRRRLFGGEYLHAEPVCRKPEGSVGPMFGGNFIFSSDSRFPSDYPIPIHDRYETPETYQESG